MVSVIYTVRTKDNKTLFTTNYAKAEMLKMENHGSKLTATYEKVHEPVNSFYTGCVAVSARDYKPFE